jgi:hypothetical protein
MRDREGRMKRRSLTLLAIVLGCVASPIRAQPNVAGRELVGLVRDARGGALEGAAVEIPGAAARSDARGAFRLYTSDLDTVTITIRRLGYNVVSALLRSRNRQWDTVMVEMEELPQRLATAEVKAATTARRNGLRDFQERRTQGRGQFYTHDQIVARNTLRTSEVLRGARGVRLQRLRSGGNGVRFASYSKNPNCIPNLWLDGQLVRDMEVDDVPANQIEAMELYESWASTPAAFSQGATLPCGTIVIWTRISSR